MPDPDDIPAPPPPRPHPLAAVRSRGAHHFFGVAAWLSLASAALAAVLPRDMPSGHRPLLVALFLAYAGLALVALRARPRRVELAIGALAIGAVLVVSASVVLTGWGVDSPLLGLLGLLTLMAGALATRRVAIGVTLLALAAPAAIAWADHAGLLARAPPVPYADTLLLRLLLQWLLIGGGLAVGWLLARVVASHVLAADERERRFRGLLAIAADAYWEIDEEYRLVALTRQLHDGQEALSADDDTLGQVPWSLPQLAIDADALDALQADLDARASFRDLLVQWVTTQGESLHFLVSGEPRFSARGVFLGYWGVARNVTADVSARKALVATEGRYQDLFEHIPTSLLLHRGGRILDANPAALSLFGQDALAGQDLLSFYEGGDSRERARRRIEELETRVIGQALPVTDFRLRGAGGRRIAVRATGVRVEAEDGPATLEIYVDDTERRTAEDAVRRSETMLSHLVATSPDVITLTDLATGRYAMVNQTFERLTGFSAAEVVGRTSIELGIWHRPEQRVQFVALVQRDGSVKDLPVEFATKSGHLVAMLVSGARFLMDRREYLVINGRDVSAGERERLEREAILDTASIGIALTREGQFVLANPCFERMLRWPEGTLSGQPGRVVWAGDEDYAKVGAAVGPALARGEVVSIEWPVRRRDGTSFLARVTANAIDPRRPTEGGTVWIVEDVTGQRQAEAALARARDDAEAANRAKSAFLANTSHELRTPLNGMIGLARLAREPGLDEARRRHYLDQIGDSAQSLAAIISDILDLSKIESGKLALEAAPFDLGALLHTLHLGYTMLADAHGLALKLDLEPGADGHVRGDALRVRQILSNYLTNALKFTERGEVRLVVRRLDAESLRFEVHDTGPGIDGATQARLFKPFTQADESTTRRFGGTGLGLSICRELAALMGGSVGVDSVPGRGSCFWAVLPLPPTETPAQADPAALPEVRGSRVLMVEDNPVNMLIAVAMLEQWGVAVEQAHDGQQAVAAVARASAEGRPFDAVLMDVQMPHMSGYEATRVLRQQHGADALPIIALTAAALVTERDEAMAAGMNDFLTKPIDADRLRATLSRWVSWRAALRA
jgi:PAS domain S-box-containing protein